MAKHLEIDDEQEEFIKIAYSNKYDRLTADLMKVQDEINKITPMLIQLGLKAPKVSKPIRTEMFGNDFLNEDYNPNLTWEQKALWIINKRPNCTAKQYVDILIEEFEPTLDKAKATNSLPPTISVAANNNKLERSKNDNGDFVYSMPKA